MNVVVTFVKKLDLYITKCRQINSSCAPCICIQDLSRKYDLVETITTLSRKSSRKYKIALSSQKLSVYDSYLIISTTFKVKCRYFGHGKKLILSTKIKKAILILLHEKALML